ncbi:MAG: acylphosphatase [Bacteroidales bacterium]|nr:acylphosphatase [Bacteroidales bacterium]
MNNLKIHISGKVYKVGFRYYVKQLAERNSITGTVQYADNHSILIKASGNEKALDIFISYCRLGCFGSQVNNISITESSGFNHRFFEIIDKEKVISK